MRSQLLFRLGIPGGLWVSPVLLLSGFSLCPSAGWLWNTWGRSLGVDPTRAPRVYNVFLQKLWGFFAIISSDILSAFFSLPPPGIHICVLVCLMVPRRFLRHSSFLFILFSFCSWVKVVSIDLSSGLLTSSSVFSDLPLSLFSEFFLFPLLYFSYQNFYLALFYNFFLSIDTLYLVRHYSHAFFWFFKHIYFSSLKHI